MRSGNWSVIHHNGQSEAYSLGELVNAKLNGPKR